LPNDERKNLDPWYITGICDGEAAFTYNRSGGSFCVTFGFKQRWDNKELVDAVRAYFNNIGGVYHFKGSVPTKNSGTTNPSEYFRVTRASELAEIISHFDRYPLQSRKKLEAYKIWREMAIYKIENFRNTDYNKLRILAEKLSDVNSKSRAFKVHSK
jgi:hypothetical protein